jgi:hypothetical protein
MARTLCRWPSTRVRNGLSTGAALRDRYGTIERMGDTHSVVSLMQARLRSGTFLGAHRRVDMSQVTQMGT